MKAHELARQLLAGPDLPVYVRGYEGGVDDVAHIVLCEIVRDYHQGSYYGSHGRWQVDAFDDEDGPRSPGLQLVAPDEAEESS